MAEDILPRIIKGYRTDVKTGKLETLPTKLDRSQILAVASGLDKAVQEGMPKIGKDKLANKILLEGRADAGTNEYNVNNKDAAALFTKLVDSGIPKLGASYAAAVLDKSQVAERLKIPFERAWNGTGKSAETKRTGQQHADRAAAFGSPEKDPKNADLLASIRRAASDQLTPQERILLMERDNTLLPALLNLAPGIPATEFRDNSTFYTKAAQEAASEKLSQARKRASSSEREASKLMFGTDVLHGLVSAYETAAGVEPPRYTFGQPYEASDPLMKYIVGAAETPKPPEPTPGILDMIKSLFN